MVKTHIDIVAHVFAAADRGRPSRLERRAGHRRRRSAGSRGGLGIDAGGFLGQGADAQAGVFKDGEIDLGAQGGALAGFDGVGRAGQEDIGDDIGDLDHVGFFEAALGHPGGAQADAGGGEGGFVTGDGVAVADDAGQIEDAGSHVAGERGAIRAGDGFAVHVGQVGVGAAEGDAQAALDQAGVEGLAVFEDLLLQRLELGRAGQLEGGGQGSDGMDMRAALLAGEDGAVELSGQGGIGGDDAGAARAAEGLVGGEGDDMGKADRGGNGPGGDQAGDVRDIGQEDGADRIGDRAEARPIRHPGVGGITGDDDLGLVLCGQGLDGIVIDLFGDRVDGVANDLEKLAGAVDRGAVGEVAAVEQVHAHDGVAWVDQGGVDGVVGRGAGERLDVDEQALGGEGRGGKGFGAAPAGQRFDDIGVFDALVVARVGIAAVVGQTLGVIEDLILAHHARLVVRVAFGVDVLELRAQRFAHGRGGGAFAGNEDQFANLAFGFDLDEFIDGRIEVGKRTLKQEISHRVRAPQLNCSPAKKAGQVRFFRSGIDDTRYFSAGRQEIGRSWRTFCIKRVVQLNGGFEGFDQRHFLILGYARRDPIDHGLDDFGAIGLVVQFVEFAFPPAEGD